MQTMQPRNGQEPELKDIIAAAASSIAALGKQNYRIESDLASFKDIQAKIPTREEIGSIAKLAGKEANEGIEHKLTAVTTEHAVIRTKVSELNKLVWGCLIVIVLGMVGEFYMQVRHITEIKEDINKAIERTR